MNSYKFGESSNVKPDSLQYGDIEYTYFVAREVVRNGEATGEFHIKIKDKSSRSDAAQFFQDKIGLCDVGIIDPENILNLEFQLYVIVKNPIILENIVDIFNQIDQDLIEKGNAK